MTLMYLFIYLLPVLLDGGLMICIHIHTLSLSLSPSLYLSLSLSVSDDMHTHTSSLSLSLSLSLFKSPRTDTANDAAASLHSPSSPPASLSPLPLLPTCEPLSSPPPHLVRLPEVVKTIGTHLSRSIPHALVPAGLARKALTHGATGGGRQQRKRLLPQMGDGNT
jgi:hypothetical protein